MKSLADCIRLRGFCFRFVYDPSSPARDKVHLMIFPAAAISIRLPCFDMGMKQKLKISLWTFSMKTKTSLSEFIWIKTAEALKSMIFEPCSRKTFMNGWTGFDGENIVSWQRENPDFDCPTANQSRWRGLSWSGFCWKNNSWFWKFQEKSREKFWKFSKERSRTGLVCPENRTTWQGVNTLAVWSINVARMNRDVAKVQTSDTSLFLTKML